jgi:hypothetical protein
MLKDRGCDVLSIVGMLAHSQRQIGRRLVAGEVALSKPVRRFSRPNKEHPLCVWIGQWPQQHVLDHREDGGVGANSQGQGEHSEQSHARRLSELSKGEAQIVQKGLHCEPPRGRREARNPRMPAG